MAGAYFALDDDFYFEDRWYLNRLRDASGAELDSRIFQYGNIIDVGPPMKAKTWRDGTPVAAEPPFTVMLDPQRHGAPMDFTFTNADTPIVTSQIGELLARIAPDESPTDSSPRRVAAPEVGTEIINVVSIVACIDERRSDIDRYEVGNRVRPEKAGQPRMITRLVIDPERARPPHLPSRRMDIAGCSLRCRQGRVCGSRVLGRNIPVGLVILRLGRTILSTLTPKRSRAEMPEKQGSLSVPVVRRRNYHCRSAAACTCYCDSTDGTALYGP